MTEATWDDEVKMPDIDWRMRASIENVPRGDSDLAEVTSLEGVLRARAELDGDHREAALLTTERPIQVDGAMVDKFTGAAINDLAARLPERDA